VDAWAADVMLMKAPAPKWDLYAGFMFSQVNSGLANGYLQRNNIDPTVGLRFRF
jgi:hypothetical protein